MTDAGTPIILYGRLYTKYQFAISEVDTFAFPQNGAVYSQGNEVIVPASGETAEDIARASAVEKSGVLLGGDLNILRPFDFINPLFLALAISNGEPQKELAKKAQGKSVVHIHNTDIQEVTIAYPSRTEQDRIVSVFRQLDNLITLHQRQPFSHSTPDISLSVQLIHPFYTSSWEQRKLSEITDKVTEKNAGLQYVETFTNSAEFGIISQRDFFDHDIAKLGSLDGYYIVKNEDFVYNPRISTSAPVGPINRNKLGRTGVMSPLYTVFRPHDIDTTYLEYFFKCGYWHSFMNFNGDSGARSDRFSIRDNVFFQMPIPIPDIDEQRKIGELLTCLDNLITLHQRKCISFTGRAGRLISTVNKKRITSSWEQRKFEEIAVRSSVICSDDTLPRVEYEDIVSGTGRLNKDIYAKQSIKSGIAFHQGDVLYGKLRPYLQNWLLPTFDGLAVGDFWVLQPQNADSSFLYRLIQSRQFDEVANQSTGTKMPRADWKLVSKTVFSIPSNNSKYAYQKRNEWMVDRSTRVIAVYNGEPSGTGNTINYAKKAGVPAVYIQA